MARTIRVVGVFLGATVALVALGQVSSAEAETVEPRGGVLISDEERGTVAAAAIDVNTDLVPRHAGAIRAQASVFVDASPDEVRDAVLDLQARAEEGWMVDAVSVYRDESDGERIHRRARWELSILGIEITYHCTYDWSRESGAIRWSLDPSRTNDLDLAEGVYELEPRAHGTTLTYTVEVGSQHAAAKPLKRSITSRNVRKLLESVRTRAEAAG